MFQAGCEFCFSYLAWQDSMRLFFPCVHILLVKWDFISVLPTSILASGINPEMETDPPLAPHFVGFTQKMYLHQTKAHTLTF